MTDQPAEGIGNMLAATAPDISQIMGTDRLTKNIGSMSALEGH